MIEKKAECGQYDARALEDWLAGLAARGLLLTERWGAFEEGKAQEVRYHLEPAEREDAPDAALVEARAATGWTYLCRTGNKLFDVWRASASHRPPRDRATPEGFAYRRAGRLLRSSWLSALLAPAGLAALYLMIAHAETFTIRGLVTDYGIQLNLVLLMLSVLFGIPADHRDRRTLRALRRAIREEETLAPQPQRKAYYRVLPWISLICSVAFLIVPIKNQLEERDGKMPPAPAVLEAFIHAEGAEAASSLEEFLASAHENGTYRASSHRTALGGRFAEYGEGGFAGWMGNSRGRWEISRTQLEVYAPQLGGFAKPLMAELREKLPHDEWEVISLDNADEACCSEERDVQILLIRSGSRVLLLRTDVPEDVRAHAAELADFLNGAA